MKQSLLTAKLASLSVLSAAFFTFGSGCSQDSSVGGDTVPGGGSGSMAVGQAGTAVAAAGTTTMTGGAGVAGSTMIGNFGGSGGSVAAVGGGGAASGGSDTGSAGTMTTAGGAATGGGGASASAGAAGAAMMGSAGMGGPSLCPVAGTTLCDGFEGAAPGAAGSDWTTIVTGGTMVVDTTKFYRGGKSMHYSGTSKTYIVEKKTFAGATKATNNSFWARYFVLSGVAAVTDYATSHAVFGTLADMADASDPNRFHFVGGSRAKLQAEIRISGDAYTDQMGMPAAADPSFPIVADGWQCWEFHVQADDSFNFYINSKEVLEMQIVAGKATMSKASFSPLPIFGQMQIGWQYFGSSQASGWIDEVAIGPNRIGCGS